MHSHLTGFVFANPGGLYLFFLINIERQMIYNAYILDFIQPIKLLLQGHLISVVKCQKFRNI